MLPYLWGSGVAVFYSLRAYIYIYIYISNRRIWLQELNNPVTVLLTKLERHIFTAYKNSQFGADFTPLETHILFLLNFYIGRLTYIDGRTFNKKSRILIFKYKSDNFKSQKTHLKNQSSRFLMQSSPIYSCHSSYIKIELK